MRFFLIMSLILFSLISSANDPNWVTCNEGYMEPKRSHGMKGAYRMQGRCLEVNMKRTSAILYESDDFPEGAKVKIIMFNGFFFCKTKTLLPGRKCSQ